MEYYFRFDTICNLEIDYLVHHDYLTDLTNEIYFYKELKKKIDQIDENENLAVLYLKIKNLDDLTNIVGYKKSNDFIKNFAKVIETCSLEAENASLYRGDQFLILLTFENENGDYSLLKQKLDNFKKTIKDFLYESRFDYLLSFNIGVSIFPEHAEDAEELLSKAHHSLLFSNLFDVPRDNNCEIFNQALFTKKLEYESLKESLEKAIDRKEFYLEFQPIVDSFTEEIATVEVLLRWKHPEMGLIPPDKFIPIAEKNGFIKDIGVWVLKQSFEFLKSWTEKNHRCPYMCVNFSSIELNDPNIIDKMEKIANLYSMPNNFIEVEITERTFGNISVDELYRLKEIGFLITLDDFGTGYSGLSYFEKFPIDILKIDKSFFDRIEKKKTRVIVEAITDVSHKLDTRVVAEGIETKEQLEIAKDLDCDYIQGYYFYKPMACEEIEKLISKSSKNKE